MAYDPVEARKMMEDVLAKLAVSGEKYKDAYVLNDVTREIDEEIVDLIGWPLLQALRLREAFKEIQYSVDRIYWEKFLKNQNTDFLTRLHSEVTRELMKRIEDASAKAVAVRTDVAGTESIATQEKQ